jgi:integrase
MARSAYPSAGDTSGHNALLHREESTTPDLVELTRRTFDRHRKAAGIPTGTMHTLRHTAATLALTATPPVPPHVVAGRLGDDPRTLLGTYAHLLPQSDAMAADAVAAILVDKPLTDSAPAEPSTAL